MSEALKDCPFDGGKAMVQGQIGLFTVKCFSCHSRTVICETEAEATEKWNIRRAPDRVEEAIPMVLQCPAGHQHIDEGEWATKPHKTHECQAVIHCRCPALYHGECAKTICGLQWRPANLATVGVAALKEIQKGGKV